MCKRFREENVGGKSLKLKYIKIDFILAVDQLKKKKIKNQVQSNTHFTESLLKSNEAEISR